MERTVQEDPSELLSRIEHIEKVLAEKNKLDSSALEKIKEARRLVGDSKLEEAEAAYAEIRTVLGRMETSAKSAPLVWMLFYVELTYLFVLLSLAYFVVKWPGFWLWAGVVTTDTKTAWFGALGGIAVGFFGLYTHIQARDFDPAYKLWYLSKPIVGGIFGWFVVLVFRVGLISLQGAGNENPQSPLLLYVIAFLAGFSERFTTRIIDRLMQVLTTWEEKPADSAGKTPPAN